MSTDAADRFFPTTPAVASFYILFWRIANPVEVDPRLVRAIDYAESLGALLPWDRYNRALRFSAVSPNQRDTVLRQYKIALRDGGLTIGGPGSVAVDEEAIEPRVFAGRTAENGILSEDRPLRRGTPAHGGTRQHVQVPASRHASNFYLGTPVHRAKDVDVRAVLRTLAEERAHEPVVETPASELQARTVMEFMGLLRLLAKNSGVNRNQLAKRACLPTSTTYHLLNPSNSVLPTKRHQIAALVRACGLPNHQVDRVMRLWVELRETNQVSMITDETDDAETTDSAPAAVKELAENDVVVASIEDSPSIQPDETRFQMTRPPLSRSLQVVGLVLMVLTALLFTYVAFNSLTSDNVSQEVSGFWNAMSGPLTAILAATTTVFSLMARRRLKLEALTVNGPPR